MESIFYWFDQFENLRIETTICGIWFSYTLLGKFGLKVEWRGNMKFDIQNADIRFGDREVFRDW